MIIKKLAYDFTVCKVADYSKVDLDSIYCFIWKTDEEKSLVCLTEELPDNAAECNKGWKAFCIQGVLDFSLIGILSQISTLLAENNISIFAVSTYNTDYIFTKQECFENAVNLLKNAGYTVV